MTEKRARNVLLQFEPGRPELPPIHLKKVASKRVGVDEVFFDLEVRKKINAKGRYVARYGHWDHAFFVTPHLGGCPGGCLFCPARHTGIPDMLIPREMEAQLVLMARDLGLVLESKMDGTKVVVVDGLADAVSSPGSIGLLENFVNWVHIDYDRNVDVLVHTAALTAAGLRLFVHTRFKPAFPHLRIAIHTAEEDLRRSLVPGSRATLGEIRDSATKYAKTRGQDKVSWAVLLLGGLTDTPEQADLLGQFLPKESTVHVSLYEPTGEEECFDVPSDDDAARYAERLQGHGHVVHVYRPRRTGL